MDEERFKSANEVTRSNQFCAKILLFFNVRKRREMPRERDGGERASEHADSDDLPKAIGDLVAGSPSIRLEPISSRWSLDENRQPNKLNRDLSVTFSGDGNFTSADIMDALEDRDFDVCAVVRSVQRKVSNNSWVVTFVDKDVKENLIRNPVLRIKNSYVFVTDADAETVFVKIYEACDEMPDTVIIGRLAHYGRILSFRRDVGQVTGKLNGIRTARMRLYAHIPSSVRIAGETIHISYASQPRTCRRCGGQGHEAYGCRDIRCFNCGEPGHRADDCPCDILCSCCLSSEHVIKRCPYVLFSGNIVLVDLQEKKAAKAKENNNSEPMDTPKENSGADAKVDGSSFAEVAGRRKRIQPEPAQTEKDRMRSSSAKRMKQQAPKTDRQNEGSRVSKKPREKEANQSNDVREREGRDRNRDNTGGRERSRSRSGERSGRIEQFSSDSDEWHVVTHNHRSRR